MICQNELLALGIVIKCCHNLDLLPSLLLCNNLSHLLFNNLMCNFFYGCHDLTAKMSYLLKIMGQLGNIHTAQKWYLHELKEEFLNKRAIYRKLGHVPYSEDPGAVPYLLKRSRSTGSDDPGPICRERKVKVEGVILSVP